MTKKVDASYRFCLRCEAKATLFDQMGNSWCEVHRQRYDLMNWGKAHGWPEINCTAAEETVNFSEHRYRYYAVGGEYALWFTACAIGTDHFMQTLSATVLAAEEEQV